MDSHVTCTKEKEKKPFSLEKLNEESGIENHCFVETYIKDKVTNLA